MRILVVEDEIRLREALVQLLKKQNYNVDSDGDGEAALDDALSGIYDVIILDVMLPKMDGISILRRIRSEGINVPVLLLTAKGETSDKIIGLDAGADDYLAKPFNTDELLARIRALGRRRGEIIEPTALFCGDIRLDTSALKLICGGEDISLTRKECELLEYLILHKEIVVPKELIIEKLWGFESEAEANHVEVYVSFLRKKLKRVKSNVTINAIRGVGYNLKADAAEL